MNELTVALAKFAGIRKGVNDLLDETDHSPRRSVQQFAPSLVGSFFTGTVNQLEVLQTQLPELYGDFAPIQAEPNAEMSEGADERMHFRRGQLEYLRRMIDQIFEIRSNSELAVPEESSPSPRVFVSHGQASDWREVQAYIEKDIEIPTLELEQQPNLGRTVLQKLEQETYSCTSAVIVMTGDDTDSDGNPRARENVLHEIGYLQAKYGLSAVCLLHEEDTSIPSNIHGLVYIPFPKGHVRATFGALTRELKSFYGI